MAELGVHSIRENKLPTLKQLSQHRIVTQNKLQSLKRQASFKSMQVSTIKSVLKGQQEVLGDQTNKTLLRSVGTLNRLTMRPRMEFAQTAECYKNHVILKKTNNLRDSNRQNTANFQNTTETAQFQPTRKTQLSINEQPICPTQQLQMEQDLLQNSLSVFYKNNLADGVKLKAIFRQQE